MLPDSLTGRLLPQPRSTTLESIRSPITTLSLLTNNLIAAMRKRVDPGHLY